MTEVLAKLISEINPIIKIGDDWVSSETEYPYCNYSYDEGETEQRSDMQFTLDIWDRSTSVAPVEGFAKDIKQKIDRKVYNLDNKLVWIYFNTMQTVRDEDQRIKRRRQVYDIFIYDKEV